MNRGINLRLKTPGRFLCWLCRVRSAHTAQPIARKTTANAVHLLLPAHAQNNVSEFDRRKGKVKIQIELDRKSEWRAERLTSGLAQWRVCLVGKYYKTANYSLVASVGSPPLRQAATTLSASFFQKMQAEIKEGNWKMYPERQKFVKTLLGKFVTKFQNQCEIEKLCLLLHAKIN